MVENNFKNILNDLTLLNFFSFFVNIIIALFFFVIKVPEKKIYEEETLGFNSITVDLEDTVPPVVKSFHAKDLHRLKLDLSLIFLFEALINLFMGLNFGQIYKKLILLKNVWIRWILMLLPNIYLAYVISDILDMNDNVAKILWTGLIGIATINIAATNRIFNNINDIKFSMLPLSQIFMFFIISFYLVFISLYITTKKDSNHIPIAVSFIFVLNIVLLNLFSISQFYVKYKPENLEKGYFLINMVTKLLIAVILGYNLYKIRV